MYNIDIYVATHKKMDLSLPPYCQLIQVNAQKNGRWNGYLHDDDYEDHISFKNNSYCELTALYALWKNSSAEIKGLFHYRRFLGREMQLLMKNENYKKISRKTISDYIITEELIEKLLLENDVIVPFDNCPFPTFIAEDLQRFVSVEDINKMIRVIRDCFPMYYDTLMETLYDTHGSYCNMFIARRKFADEYCAWLFGVLEKVEAVTPISTYDSQHQRIFGYYAEVLLNVYIRHHHYKTAKVYRVDLNEKTKVPAVRMISRNIISSILCPFGIYPVRPNRSLWKARFLWLTDEDYREKTSQLYQNARSAEDIAEYFELTGGKNITIACGKLFDSISGDFLRVSTMYFICKSQEGIDKILQLVDKTRRETRPFGEVCTFRILLSADIPAAEQKRLRNLGIML